MASGDTNLAERVGSAAIGSVGGAIVGVGVAMGSAALVTPSSNAFATWVAVLAASGATMGAVAPRSSFALAGGLISLLWGLLNGMALNWPSRAEHGHSWATRVVVLVGVVLGVAFALWWLLWD